MLSHEEEEHLAKWAIQMAKVGYVRTKQELLDTVQTIINTDGKHNPFKNNRPGKNWYQAFLRRHPELSHRQQQQLGKERAVISQERVVEWLKDYMNIETDDHTYCPIRGGGIMQMKAGSP